MTILPFALLYNFSRKQHIMREEAKGHLKQACRLTGAGWAALVGAKTGSRALLAVVGLPAARARSLDAWLNAEDGGAWYRSLRGKQRASALRLPSQARLGVGRIWGYSLPEGAAIVVGADELDASARQLWSLVAGLIGSSDASSAAARTGLQPEAAYDSQQALDGILLSFLSEGHDQCGWLAIRRGEHLIVAVEHNAKLPRGSSFELESSPLLRRIHRTHSGVIAKRGGTDWDYIPHTVSTGSTFWAGLPLVVDERFIGCVAIWGGGGLSTARRRELSASARDISRHVDLVLSLGEVTAQLHRLATLNEFALAISSAEELPQMARRVLEHLGAIFPGHEIRLYVPSVDGARLQEFQAAGSQFVEEMADLSQHPMARWFGGSAQARSDTPISGSSELADGRMQFTLPLRYRGSTVGALALEGPAGPELSRYDRSMLAVVASYMAGVVEHGRLRTEAIDRAQRLEETVQQLRAAEFAAGARLEAQQAAESRLVQAAKLVAVGEMAAGVAHELNNPLTTVSGFAELILDETPAEAPFRADLEMVLHEARRARSVVRRLLDFARQGEHVTARADINEIVEDVLALMTHFVHTSGVQLEVELGPDLPWMTLDANQIKQVLLNLLHNALHAMAGGGRLQIRTELRRKESRDWIVIHVVDNGIGIDPGELKRIFDPFYTTRAESGGTGLGLSVTYGIVSDHGGTIEVQSQRGSGSTFSVWLPV